MDRALHAHHAEDPRADLEVLDAVTDGLHPTGEVASDHRGELVGHEVLHVPDRDRHIEGVHRGRPNPHQYLTRPGNGIRDIHHLRSTLERLDRQRLHHASLRLGTSTNLVVTRMIPYPLGVVPESRSMMKAQAMPPVATWDELIRG